MAVMCRLLCIGLGIVCCGGDVWLLVQLLVAGVGCNVAVVVTGMLMAGIVGGVVDFWICGVLCLLLWEGCNSCRLIGGSVDQFGCLVVFSALLFSWVGGDVDKSWCGVVCGHPWRIFR